MIEVSYAQEFIRAYGKLDPLLKKDVKERISLFRDRENHKTLRVHKLHGTFSHLWSFSVNYKFRIVFQYIGKKKKTVILHMIGDHSIYD